MFNFYKPYTGLGDPKTPSEVLEQMTRIATRLQEEGFTLRTNGDQQGAEGAFEKGAGDKIELHLAWRNFNKRNSKINRVSDEAVSVVKSFIPAHNSLKESVLRIIGSKVHAIMGEELKTPTKFFVCWSPDGAETGDAVTPKTGYMGIPIKVASSMRLPVFNLKNPDAMERLWKFVQTLQQ